MLKVVTTRTKRINIRKKKEDKILLLTYIISVNTNIISITIKHYCFSETKCRYENGGNTIYKNIFDKDSKREQNLFCWKILQIKYYLLRKVFIVIQ